MFDVLLNKAVPVSRYNQSSESTVNGDKFYKGVYGYHLDKQGNACKLPSFVWIGEVAIGNKH